MQSRDLTKGTVSAPTYAKAGFPAKGAFSGPRSSPRPIRVRQTRLRARVPRLRRRIRRAAAGLLRSRSASRGPGRDDESGAGTDAAAAGPTAHVEYDRR